MKRIEFPKQKRKEMIKLYRLGKNFREIERLTGYGHQIVRLRMIEWGIHIVQRRPLATSRQIKLNTKDELEHIELNKKNMRNIPIPENWDFAIAKLYERLGRIPKIVDETFFNYQKIRASLIRMGIHPSKRNTEENRGYHAEILDDPKTTKKNFKKLVIEKLYTTVRTNLEENREDILHFYQFAETREVANQTGFHRQFIKRYLRELESKGEIELFSRGNPRQAQDEGSQLLEVS